MAGQIARHEISGDHGQRVNSINIPLTLTLEELSTQVAKSSRQQRVWHLSDAKLTCDK